MKQNKGFFNKKSDISLSQDTTKSKTQSNLTPKPSHKKLQIFAGTSLAIFMGISTLCGVFLSPTSATKATTTPTNSTTTTQPQTTGLITPKEDDPVLFTTESGIDIKIALSLPSFNRDLQSGNLIGLPYFTTTGTGGTYTWVVIGQGTDGGILNVGWEKFYTANIWINEISILQADFYENIYEYQTPAGLAINNNTLTTDKGIIHDKDIIVNIVKNAEIPKDCVLCFCNTIVTSTRYTGNTTGSGDFGSGDLTTRSACSLTALGLSNFSSQIQATTVQRRQWDGQVSTQSNLTLFSMGAVLSSYNITTYLTSNQRKLGSGYWTGDNYTSYDAGIITTGGSYSVTEGTYGIRPAFVLKLV